MRMGYHHCVTLVFGILQIIQIAKMSTRGTSSALISTFDRGCLDNSVRMQLHPRSPQKQALSSPAYSQGQYDALSRSATTRLDDISRSHTYVHFVSHETWRWTRSLTFRYRQTQPSKSWHISCFKLYLLATSMNKWAEIFTIHYLFVPKRAPRICYIRPIKLCSLRYIGTEFRWKAWLHLNEINNDQTYAAVVPKSVLHRTNYS